MKPTTLTTLMAGVYAISPKTLKHCNMHLREQGLFVNSDDPSRVAPVTPRMAAETTAAILWTERQTDMPFGVHHFSKMTHAPHLSRGDVPMTFGNVSTMSALDFVEHVYAADTFDDPTCEAGFFLEFDRTQKKMTVYFGESISRPHCIVWKNWQKPEWNEEYGLRVKLGLAGRDMRSISRVFSLERQHGEPWETLSKMLLEAA